uniref:Uncharacterized protein n=1 Tax=viral metagenome TaxID=1070528 RepID=A0A6C0I8J3_9ZZZZ
MSEGGRKKQPSAWIKHVMAYSKAHGMKFGDALSKAGPSFKSKTAKHGGQLLSKGTPMGGRRRTAKRGGALYGFTGGDYVGSQLSDGAGRFPRYDVENNNYPTTGMIGGRRSRGRRYSRRR